MPRLEPTMKLQRIKKRNAGSGMSFRVPAARQPQRRAHVGTSGRAFYLVHGYGSGVVLTPLQTNKTKTVYYHTCIRQNV